MHNLFKKRKATRSYQSLPIEKDKLDEILAAANSAPSAGNLKARKIIVIEDQNIKKKLVKASLGQDFIEEAPVVLVFVALPKVSAKKYGQRGEELYGIQDATVAASFAWLEAVDLGLYSCWVGGFFEEEVQKILDLSESERPIAILPIGRA